MAINKVVYGGSTLMDITDTTATDSDVLEGTVYYNAAGVRSVGTALAGISDVQTSNGTSIVSDLIATLPDYVLSSSVTSSYDAEGTNPVNGIAVAAAVASVSIPVTSVNGETGAVYTGYYGTVIISSTTATLKNISIANLYNAVLKGKEVIYRYSPNTIRGADDDLYHLSGYCYDSGDVSFAFTCCKNGIIKTITTGWYDYTNNSTTITGALSTVPIPDSTSDLTNDSDFQTSSDVSTAIASAIGDINSFNVEVVSALPSTNIDDHTIYFAPNSGDNNNIYDEWMYINESWEKLGTTEVDLSGYVQTSRTINGHALSSDIILDASDVGAATESYVDSAVSSAIDDYVPKYSEYETQNITVTNEDGNFSIVQTDGENESRISFSDGNINIERYDYEWDGTSYINLSSGYPGLSISGLKTPKWAYDAATKSYVDSQISDLSIPPASYIATYSGTTVSSVYKYNIITFVDGLTDISKLSYVGTRLFIRFTADCPTAYYGYAIQNGSGYTSLGGFTNTGGIDRGYIALTGDILEYICYSVGGTAQWQLVGLTRSNPYVIHYGECDATSTVNSVQFTVNTLPNNTTSYIHDNLFLLIKFTNDCVDSSTSCQLYINNIDCGYIRLPKWKAGEYWGIYYSYAGSSASASMAIWLNPQLPTSTSELTNDSDFQTGTEVSAAISSAISNIAIPSAVSELTNDAGYITTYTESDPVFSSSAAATISNDDISSWNAKASYVTTTAALSSAAWNSGSMTVTVSGVTSSNLIQVAPAPSCSSYWATSGVLCTAQDTDELTFEYESMPEVDLTANIVIWD